MGFSTVSCRLRDASGREFEHTFVVPNESSDGNVTDEEFRMAVGEMVRQGLPEGTTLVSDEFTLRESNAGASWFARHFGGDSVRMMTGVAQFFRTRSDSQVIVVPTVVIGGDEEQPIPVVGPEELPQVDARGRPIPTVKVEDLPPAPRSVTSEPHHSVASPAVVRVEDLPQVDAQGRPIRTVKVEDLPRA